MPGSDEPKGPPGQTVAGDGSRIEVLFDEQAIRTRVRALADEIAAAGFTEPLVVPVLTGSFLFAADLIRALHGAAVTPEIDFISLSSYGQGTEPGGRIDILRDLKAEPAGRDVLIVDDILDTGRTLAFVRDLLAARGARRVAACVLLDKQARRTVPVEAEYVGFDCPDIFVVGYGMDLAHRFRELPFVGRIV